MKSKNLKLITEIIAIIIICLVSFVGIYKQNANTMQNKVKDYEFSKDLEGYRELVFKVSDATEVLDSSGNVVGDTDSYTDSTIESNSYQKTENKINADDKLTVENYEKAKSIIEKRLKGLKVEDYNISLNTENGDIYLQIPENSETDHTVSNILQVANFEIKDSEDTSNVLIKNEDLKKISAVYNTTTSGTTVYLQIEFNKNGKKVLKQLSTGEYATNENLTNTSNSTESSNTDENTSSENTQADENTASENAQSDENTTSENTQADENANTSSENSDNTSSEDSNKETQKKIILSIDSNDMITTSFDDPIEDGVIDLSMNKATTDQDSISDTLQSASTIAIVVNSGKMPLTYKVSENNYITTDISKDMLRNTIILITLVVAIGLVLLAIKYKFMGLMACIAYIGFIGIELLLVRYTNVMISLESIVAEIVVLAINYFITYRLLKIHESDKELKKKVYLDEFKFTIEKFIPIFIIAVVFVFVEFTKISTFGMFMFWGVLLSIIYNFTITKDMLD